MERLIKEEAISKSITAREKAILIKESSTKVGACLYTVDKLYEGFNIQNRCHKSYHAEEIAVLNAMLSEEDPTNILGIVVTFSKNDIKQLTFCCGYCRQILWEYTRNPELEVLEVNPETREVIKTVKLGELYPYPYPR